MARPFQLIDPLPIPRLYRRFRAELVSGVTLAARVGVDGTLVNTPTQNAESFGLSAASKERVTSSGIDLTALESGFTMLVRAKPASIPGSEFKLAMAVAYPTAGGPFYRGISIGITQTTGKVRLYMAAGSAPSEQIVSSSTAWSTTEPYTVIVSWDGTTRRGRIYDADGTLLEAFTDTPGITPLFAASALVEQRHQQVDARYWDGTIWADALWDLPLSEYEADEAARRVSLGETLWPNPDPTIDRLLGGTPIRPVYLVEIQPKGEGFPQPASQAFRFEFDERSGHLVDATGNGIDSTSETGVAYRHRGRCADASAINLTALSSSRVVLGSVALDDDGGTIAIGFRARSTGARQVLWGLFDLTDGTDPDRIVLAVSSTGALQLSIRAGGATGTATAASTVTLGLWHDAIVTWHKSGADTIVNMWVDGTQVGTTITIAGKLLIQPTTALTHILGSDADAGPVYNEGLLGEIDSLDGWTVRLTADEVAQLFRWRLHSAFRALSGDTMIDRYPLSIADVEPVTTSLDIVQNQTTAEDVEIDTVWDGWFGYLKETYRLVGAKVTIREGDQRARGVSEYETVFVGSIVTTLPKDDGSGQLIRCAHRGFEELLSKRITGAFIGHPLEVSAQLMDLAIADGGDVSYDADSFDPSQSQYSEISHWQVQRYGADPESGTGPVRQATVAPWGTVVPMFSREVSSETAVGALLGELWPILPGRIRLSAEGEIAFQLYDPERPVDAVWIENQILGLDIVETDENVGNVVKFDVSIEGKDGADHTMSPRGTGHRQKAPIDPDYDPYSKTPEISNPPGAGSYKFEWVNQASIDIYGDREITAPKCSWLGGVHQITNYPDDSTPIAQIHPCNIAPGMAGVAGFSLKAADRTPGAGPPSWLWQEDWRKVSSGDGRYLYLFDGRGIVRVGTVFNQFSLTDVTLAPHVLDTYGYRWPNSAERFVAYDGSVSWLTTDNDIYYDDLTLDFDGTTSAESYFDLYRWGASIAKDVTIERAWAQMQLDRFANGVPIVRVRLHPRHRNDADLGDFVAFSWPFIEWPWFGGPSDLSSTVTWEVIGKARRTQDETQPCVEYTLAYVSHETFSPVDLTFGQTFEAVRPVDREGAQTESYYLTSELDLTYSPSNWDLSFPAGDVLRRGSRRWTLPAFEATLYAGTGPTEPDWTETVVFYDTLTGTYVLQSYAEPDFDLAAIQAEAPDWYAFILYATTDDAGTVGSPVYGYATDGTGGLVGSTIGGLIPSSAIPTAGVSDDQTVRTKRGTVQTTNATPTVVLTVPLTASTAYYLNAIIVARKTDDTAWAFIQQEGGAHRAGAGAVVDNNTQSENLTGSGWTAAWVANGNNVELQVTGAAATTINWAARARWEEAA